MIRSISLVFCRIDIGPGWACTHFPDGSSYGAHPHDTAEYRALAARCGYGDIEAYCIEHEIGHAVVAEALYAAPSRVIWGCAHDRHAASVDILHEESLVIDLQTFARANLLPGASAPGFSWFDLRDRFMALCDGS